MDEQPQSRMKWCSSRNDENATADPPLPFAMLRVSVRMTSLEGLRTGSPLASFVTFPLTFDKSTVQADGV